MSDTERPRLTYKDLLLREKAHLEFERDLIKARQDHWHKKTPSTELANTSRPGIAEQLKRRAARAPSEASQESDQERQPD